MECASGGHTQSVPVGAFAAIAALVLGSAYLAILVVMFRASKDQRARTKRTSFDGRYSDFGFVLGILRSAERSARRRRGGDERVDR